MVLSGKSYLKSLLTVGVFAVVLSVSAAFATSPSNVYVRARSSSVLPYRLELIGVTCDASGPYVCWITVASYSEAAGLETVKGRDKSGVLLRGESYVANDVSEMFAFFDVE